MGWAPYLVVGVVTAIVLCFLAGGPSPVLDDLRPLLLLVPSILSSSTALGTSDLDDSKRINNLAGIWGEHHTS